MTSAASAGAVSAEGAEAPNTDISTSKGSDPGSSSAGAQSAAPSSDSGKSAEELRDEATFARYGLKPDGSPLDPPAKGEDEDESDDDADATGTEATAADDDEDTDEPGEITGEQLDRYVEALLELDADKIAKNPKLRERIEADIRAQVEQDYAERQRAATVGQERQRLTEQGKTAVEAVSNLLTKADEGFAKATAELAKAERGEDFNPKVVAEGLGVTVDQLRNNLATYAQAVTFDVRRQHEDAFLGAFQRAAAKGGPITPDEVKTIESVVNNANRTEKDESQGEGRFDKAKSIYYGETMVFLVDRAYEAGRQAAVAEAKAKREAAKTVLDADAVLAGAAKEAAKRSALPPATPPAGQQPDSGAATMDAYRAAKAAGEYDKADAIMQRMMRSAPPEAQRRLRR